MHCHLSRDQMEEIKVNEEEQKIIIFLRMIYCSNQHNGILTRISFCFSLLGFCTLRRENEMQIFALFNFIRQQQQKLHEVRAHGYRSLLLIYFFPFM